MKNKPFVWQMVKEAAEQSENEIITYEEIREYITARYGNVNTSTINAQIIEGSVNHPSRVHFSKNIKPRISNRDVDFLFNVGRGKVSLYDSNKHGVWCITRANDGKLVVAEYTEDSKKTVSSAVSMKSNKPANKIQKRKSQNADVPRPCKSQMEYYLDAWNNLGNYTLQEDALNELFFKTYPKNSDINHVLIKASSLNDFYSTNIFSIFPVAKHIFNLDIDERLADGDENLVNEIAVVKMENGSVKKFYSFATKYCSHHKPLDYPIYDRYVDRILRHFRDVDGFYFFRNDDLKDYKAFKGILSEFRDFYELTDYMLKDIDKYIWQLGKEKFPIRY